MRPETISRWNTKPEYRQLVEDLVAELTQQTVAHLMELLPDALLEIEEALRYRHDHRVRFRAACKIVDMVGVGRLASSRQAARPVDDE